MLTGAVEMTDGFFRTLSISLKEGPAKTDEATRTGRAKGNKKTVTS